MFESIYFPRKTFHGIHSYTDDGVLMEIEVYTEHIEYTDKNDLLRIKDIYCRDKNNYESSVYERPPKQNEIMQFKHPNSYYIRTTNVSILNTSTVEGLYAKYDKVILLNGIVYNNFDRTWKSKKGGVNVRVFRHFT